MYKVLISVGLMMMVAGCIGLSDKFVASQIEGQHEKAMEFLGQSEGTLVYKDTQLAKECKRAKLKERGYWMMQDEIDCFQNAVK